MAIKTVPITKLFSAASLGKAALRSMGIRPLLELNPDFPLERLGWWMSAYFGGRADVRVRKVEVPVTVLDFSSEFPSLFIGQDLQALLTASTIGHVECTAEVRELLERITLDDLFDPAIWPLLNCIVECVPDDDIYPVRFKFEPTESLNVKANATYQIAITHLTSDRPLFYTLADCIGAKISGNRIPKITRAFRAVPVGVQGRLRPARFRGDVVLDPRTQIFKVIIEMRQRAKAAGDLRLASALKVLANSASYGVHVEINVRPWKMGGAHPGAVYGERVFDSRDVHDEQPGEFFNPIIGALVTGGARLRLAMLERLVTDRGGTYAFCDTDSLAVVCGAGCLPGVPSLSRDEIDVVVSKFDQLNPYDRSIIPHLLKVEYDEVRCHAISAKRYVLSRRNSAGQREIVKASESGLGALIDDRKSITSESLVHTIWRRVLAREDGEASDDEALRIPVRRYVPISRPGLLHAFDQYNSSKLYRDQIKPFNFLQTVTPALQDKESDLRPVAAQTKTAAQARRAKWFDVSTGESLQLDWTGSGHAGTVTVQSLEDFVNRFASHPEAKAADRDGKPAQDNARGLLGRLHLIAVDVAHIGKEVDREEEDEGFDILSKAPITYGSGHAAKIARGIARLTSLPNITVAAQLGISERRWRDIKKRGYTNNKRIQHAILHAMRREWRN